MDHIPLPGDDLAHAPIEVPRLRLNSLDAFVYDDNGMLTFPTRCGIDPALLAADDHPNLPLLGASAAAFIQAWLWCGLLQEALRVGFRSTTAPRRASAEVLFVRPGDQGQRSVVSLRRLPEVLASDADRAPAAGEWQRERTLSCINTALSFVGDVFRDPKAGAQLLVLDGQARLPETTIVLLSVQVLCQALLENTVIPLYGDSRTSRYSVPPPQSSRVVDFLLRHSGWRLQDIDRLPRDIVARYRLTFFNRHTNPLPDPHDDKPIVPVHTHVGCQCGFVSAHVPDPLSPGDTVLVRFVRETRSIETMAVRTKPRPPFLAISHVRSAGLGTDADESSLPLCQLARLQSLADDIMCTDGAYFWIDSLCLPHSRHNRRRAARTSWGNFLHATAVAVLDPHLFQHLTLSAEEALLRIRYSAWKSRLWTLEEGFFPTRLVICFANRNVLLDRLLTDLESEHMPLRPGTVKLLRPCKPFLSWMDEDKLTYLIVNVAKDVRLLLPSTAESEEQLAYKHSLQRLLRLAYLLAGKFRYFLEEDERNVLPGLWWKIDTIYSNLTEEESTDYQDPTPSKIMWAQKRIGTLLALLDGFPQTGTGDGSFKSPQTC